eukprot:COSAG02_NODE_7611_length_2935_cov_1.518688_2_plen_113_part_00
MHKNDSPVQLMVHRQLQPWLLNSWNTAFCSKPVACLHQRPPQHIRPSPHGWHFHVWLVRIKSDSPDWQRIARHVPNKVDLETARELNKISAYDRMACLPSLTRQRPAASLPR